MEFLKKLGLFLGWGIPPGEQEPTVNEEPTRQAQVAPGYWALGFDSVLPGVHGRCAVPVGPGKVLVIPFRALTVSETFGLLGNLAQAREEWPFGPAPEAFAGYVALEGPGWDLTVLYSKPAPRVEYHANRTSGGVTVAGEAVWPIVAQALLLAPAYEAVVGYLTLNPYREGYLA
jgi:hypothetical protein